jgi:alpha-galactosidase
MKQILFIIGFFFSLNCIAQKFEGLAKTPPMGWNSWNAFSCNIDEKIIREMADAMVASGLKDAGYVYINIDDCWQGERDSLGFIQPNSKKFPSGIKALADYVHAKGLKLGIYSDAGFKTCGGKMGSRGYEFQDALTYAKWGVDYLKYDWCNTKGINAQSAYETMATALKKTGRPIVFSVCEWGKNKPWEWAASLAHLWRTTGDIYNCFDCLIENGKFLGVMPLIDRQEKLRQYAGPDHWNDPDMLEIGNGKLTPGEERIHFSMWAMLAAPLIAGNDLRNMSKQTIEILTNQDVIAVDQDSLGIQAFKYAARDSVDIWVKPLARGDWAICFLNRSRQNKNIEFSWQSEKIVDDLVGKEINAKTQEYQLKNLWTHKIIGSTKKNFSSFIPGHDIIMLRLIKK